MHEINTLMKIFILVIFVCVVWSQLLNEMKQAEEKKMVTGRGPSLKPDEFVNVVQ